MRAKSLMEILGSRTLKRSVSVFVVRMLGIGLTFVTTIVLARLLDMDSYGEYAWALSWITVLRLVVSLGYDKLVVREVSVMLAGARQRSIWSLLRWCIKAVFVASAVTMGFAAISGYFLADPQTLQFSALAVSLVALPLMALMTLASSAVQAHSYPLRARLPEDIVYPGVFLAIIGLLWVFHSETDPGSLAASAGRNLALMAAVATAAILLYRSRDVTGQRREPLSRIYRKSMLVRSLPLVIMGGSNVLIVELGTIVIGVVDGSEAAAGYSVAIRIAFTLTIAEFAVNQVIAPRLAKMLHEDATADVQGVVTRGAQLVLATVAVGGLVVAAGAPWILAIFGSQYEAAVPELRMMVVAWLLNLGAGPCGLLLTMGGREQDAAVGLAVGAAVSVPLTIVLTILVGPLGAALSAACSMLLWNTLLVRRCWLIWGVDTTPFCLLRRWGRVGEGQA